MAQAVDKPVHYYKQAVQVVPDNLLVEDMNYKFVVSIFVVVLLVDLAYVFAELIVDLDKAFVVHVVARSIFAGEQEFVVAQGIVGKADSVVVHVAHRSIFVVALDIELELVFV